MTKTVEVAKLILALMFVIVVGGAFVAMVVGATNDGTCSAGTVC